VFLGRTAGPTEEAIIGALLRSGTVTSSGVMAAFLGSDEFFAGLRAGLIPIA